MADESWSWFDDLRDAHARKKRHTPAPPPPPPLQRGDAVELAIEARDALARIPKGADREAARERLRQAESDYQAARAAEQAVTS